MSEAYSPLRYPGGKAKLSTFLIEVMRANRIVEPHYVEPYAGGAGAALRLLFEEYVDRITINDADPRVRCMWEAVTQHTEEFRELILTTDVTVEEWMRQRGVYVACDDSDALALGWSTFFLNRTTRSGIVHNGGPIGGFDQTGNYGIDVRFNRQQLATRIHRISIFADRITVSGLDGLELLRSLDDSKPKPRSTFVYLDPPYFHKGAELYLNRLTHEEHAELARYLATRKPYLWLMTYDNVEQIRKFYRRLPQVEFSLSYSAYERREGEELLIHPRTLKVPQTALDALPALSA